MRRLRFLFLTVLSLALVAGSVMHGHMRLQHHPVTLVELCRGFETITVAVDGRGQPVKGHGPIHCADCLPALTTLAAAGGGQGPDGIQTLRRAGAWPLNASLALAQRSPGHRHARAPPVTA